MTGRERVLAAMRHEEPDRTPLFERLIKSPHSDELLGRPCAATNFDFQMSLLADGAWEELCLLHARDIVDLANMLGFDMVAVGANAGPPSERPVRVAPGVWRLGTTKATMQSSGWVRYESLTPPPSEPPSEAEQAASHEACYSATYAPSHDPDGYRTFREVVRLLREAKLDLAIYSSCYGMPVCTLAPLQFEWFHTRPELMASFYRWHSEHACHVAGECVREGAHIVGLGGDLACDTGPVISPGHYRRFIVPEIARQADTVHDVGAYATNTSDGRLWPIIDDFLLGAGVDGFGEIDIAAGMDLPTLKRRFGGRICFLGNLDIRFVLTRGTRDQCHGHMVDCIRAGWGNGGHIIMTSNVVHEDVKLANYLACIDAYREYFGLDGLGL